MRKLLWEVLVILLFLLSKNVSAQSGSWTWMAGDSVIGADIVTVGMGIPNTRNTPGGRYEPSYWTDTLGRFWLFGGAAYGEQWLPYANNALWMFDPEINMWTWVNGTLSFGASSEYGTKGIPDPSNTPGARYGATTWIDKNGDLLLFGGAYADFGGAPARYYNDLWKYHISTNEWTWVGGSQKFNLDGVYGLQGLADSTNLPGTRYLADSWVDKDGNLWMFGGLANSSYSGITYYNDLWKYDVNTSLWTWMKGSSDYDAHSTALGNYGEKGIADSSNTPGGRECKCHWQDSSGNFYLFGGQVQGKPYDHFYYGNFNDVWKYDPIANEWSWISGMDSLNYYSRKNELCQPPVNNAPPNKGDHNCWIGKDDNFYFFGGDITTYHVTSNNAIWKLNLNSMEWTWLDGFEFQEGYQQPFYGIKGVEDPRNTIPMRYGAAQWIDKQGNVWIFGGFLDQYETLDDLWRYTPDSTCTVATIVPSIINQSRSLFIYPNPATDKIQIQSQTSNQKTISILTLLGQLVFQNTFYSSELINISSFPKGMYIVKITDQQGNLMSTEKLVTE